MGWLVGGEGFSEFFRRSRTCVFLVRGMVGRACCALFDMLRDYLFLERMGTGGAVGVTEHIAWFFVPFFFGERGIQCRVFCACNVVLIVCVLTLSVAVAGDLFVLFFISDVVGGRL